MIGRVFGVVAVAAICVPAFAFAQGTEEEREACTPDVFRLCGKFIPDAGRIESCLRDAGPRLSPACHMVFYPPSAANQPMPVRERGRRDPVPMPPPSDDNDDEDR